MKKAMDGNIIAVYISYTSTEVAATYPVTPSLTMAGLIDEWTEGGLKSIHGQKIQVTEMQSGVGVAGVVRGSLKTGMLAITYTVSQGLPLTTLNMYKITGELLPSVFHVATQAVTTSALSILDDHGGVMAIRQTGFCMLAKSSIREVMNLSAVAHLIGLEGSLPLINSSNGFRTSHKL